MKTAIIVLIVIGLFLVGCTTDVPDNMDDGTTDDGMSDEDSVDDGTQGMPDDEDIPVLPEDGTDEPSDADGDMSDDMADDTDDNMDDDMADDLDDDLPSPDTTDELVETLECCESYGNGAMMVECCWSYEMTAEEDCMIEDGMVGGNMRIVKDVFCADEPRTCCATCDSTDETCTYMWATECAVPTEDTKTTTPVHGKHCIGKLQFCPDEKIDNQMPPSPGGDMTTEYYVVDGKRFEIEDFDADWVTGNCEVETTVAQ
ncbi:MAG: hypothetical protein KKG59_03430 [Nanoarchaeota archaeon]|nr:hypothetical protein [Nanoarchaeota archaeon]